MKIYSCKMCKSKGKEFKGVRFIVRKHLREEHMVRGLSRDALGKRQDSMITKNTIAEDLK